MTFKTPVVVVESPNASASAGASGSAGAVAAGRSKTRRVLLRDERAEFGASTFSASLGFFTAPNRDYAFEGLSFFGSANWKYLDALFFALQAPDGSFALLEPELVRITPFDATYSYAASAEGGRRSSGGSPPRGRVEASYSLDGNVLTMRLENKARFAQRSRFVLKPLVDVRFMYADSAPFEHEISFSRDKKIFAASRAGHRLLVECPDFESAALDSKPQHWVYSLGSGERASRNGRLEFRTEERVVLDAGELRLRPAKKSVVKIYCGGIAPREQHDPDVARSAQHVLSCFANELAAAEARWGREASEALAGRLLSLHNFFLRCHHASFVGPDAGCFWFRDFWFRDALEGVRVNKGVYSRTRGEWLSNFLDSARHFSLNGLLPTRFAEESGAPVYDSADASLLFYPLALDFFEERGDSARFGKTLRGAEKFFDSLQGGSRFKRFAEVEDFLVKTPANCSWTDSVSGGIPNRLPREWRSAENARRKFFLVELNASWIRFLARTGFLPRGADSLERVVRAFKQKFFSQFPQRFPSHVAGEASAVGFERSREKSSLALEAVALLPELFSDAEVAGLLEKAKPLLVRRNGALFAPLLRERAEVFLGDGEYHGGVVWLREAPFLELLLLRVGRFREVEEMLLNALDHQQNESAVFYSNELFSVDSENDEQNDEQNEVVPVKNPAQYWSNWVQPFFDYLAATQPHCEAGKAREECAAGGAHAARSVISRLRR